MTKPIKCTYNNHGLRVLFLQDVQAYASICANYMLQSPMQYRIHDEHDEARTVRENTWY
jgi:hypothetical protein